MKLKRLIALVMLCCFILCGAASATGEGDSDPVEETPVEDITPDDPIPDEPAPDEPAPDELAPDESTPDESTPDEPSPDEPSPDEPISDEVTPEGNEVVYLEVEPDSVDMGYSTYEVSDADSRSGSTMAGAIVAVFGEYQPITHTVTDHLSDGSSVTYEQVVPGLAGVDWVWVSGVGFTALVLYSVFRLLGVFVK